MKYASSFFRVGKPTEETVYLIVRTWVIRTQVLFIGILVGLGYPCIDDTTICCGEQPISSIVGKIGAITVSVIIVKCSPTDCKPFSAAN